ncbi:MAG: elongation factor P maturation arginine rhamnosyltransferase EarP [Gallionellaceae bacterium]|jgi:uncharacterized repeat protein (TIGR03837 family)|nr:elongation factor P maturation arginine rhamnosyltransferase EarP [Gallionellaceae bacterium]
MTKPSCDIFCAVVDNYGDIGVCWRLARQLAQEHGCAVRLWVDDLASFARLCPEVDARLDSQHDCGVEVRHWRKPFAETAPAQFVIEAFACTLPPEYLAAMARLPQPPVWVNLEYLSAEDWVEGCHKLPSPHPSLPLVKYFFFPGFTEKTGGLLLENDLFARRDAFQSSPLSLDGRGAGERVQDVMPQPPPLPNPSPARGEGLCADETRISLFCYKNPALTDLLHIWAQAAAPVRCLMPEGRALPQAAAFFGKTHAAASDVLQRGNLTLHVLPFVEQDRYDELLWDCDINFVRGEDSFVRAQWAAQPFVWHIYPQHDGVHLQKLRAFMEKFCDGLATEAARALTALWEGWNGGRISGEMWDDFFACRDVLRRHGMAWAERQAGNSLALNLLNFYRQSAPKP